MSFEDFEAFFGRHYRPLVRTLWGYCGDQAVAEDSAQEAFVRISGEWERVRGMQSPSGWLHRVAFNVVNAHYRRRQAERRALDRQRRLEPVDDRLADVAEAVTVRRAMRDLPDRHRAAVALFYFADLGVAEIAQVMAAAPSTVKSWLHRGRQQLGAQLTDQPHRQETTDVP